MDQNKITPEQMMAAIQKLPEETQRSIYWVANHMRFVEIITSGDPLTKTEIKEMAECALKTNDDLLLVLLEYKLSKGRQKP